MGLDKRTIKIIVIVTVTVLVIGGIIGLVLGLLLPYRYVELEVWPRSDAYNYEQPLIHFRVSDSGTWHPWYKKLNEFLKPYETTVPEEPPRAPCSVHHHEQRLPVPNCERALSTWAPCNVDNFYGYREGRPCVFLRLNHIHYWVPEPYNVTVPLSIPQDMPNNIKKAMHLYPANQYGDFIWVSCKGEFAADEENIGPIQYIPANMPPGFPASRLRTADRIPRSDRSLPDLISGPLIAVVFENPHRGVVINVECRIWTRDIVYDRNSRVGRARFELYIE
ncbi:sodium/potassium-transporting ATPase subunit beta-2-like [Vanessa atalanta]|uniref:sodium/potassium-transporting ATPase subunit beta-2-like n=1 Tax=Vanessa atalanta TaxID=42275 RepID=UPI001FCD7787|nr:sodium/potassium-transporting ATPase subunit beta-2-like [Vanessa atalanta]